MNEYISRESLIKSIEADFNRDYWSNYVSENYINGVRDEYDDVLRIICQQKAADVQPVDRWISVDDKLPKEWYEVLVYREIGKTEQAIYVNGKWKLAAFIGDIADVTHWQPLPEPPKDGDKE